MTFTNRRNQTIITFRPDEVIFHEGARGDKMFIIRSGEVALSKTIDDLEVPLQNLPAGTVFGEMALVDNQPRSATARAVTEVTCLVISKMIFRHKLTTEVPQWMQSFYGMMVVRLRMFMLQSQADRVGLPGHQIIELLAMLLRRGATDDQGQVSIPWDQTTGKIAYILRLPEKQVSQVLEVLSKSELAEFVFNQNRQKLFIAGSLETFQQFADFSQESFLVERRRKQPQNVRKIKELEREFQHKLHEIIGVDAGTHELEVKTLTTRLKEGHGQSLERYASVIHNLMNLNIIVKENKELQGLIYNINLDLYKSYVSSFDLYPLFKKLLERISASTDRPGSLMLETPRLPFDNGVFNA
ncbi:MAG: cyclic nucleotide-binding domain-containing protein [Candidatus Marinimicrobia bacterium]|nr:cyclic nucleotide-binding domain-containing protein [Candidatus Neomarinimicrobiota bacterium]